jgi:hypothetical protein
MHPRAYVAPDFELFGPKNVGFQMEEFTEIEQRIWKVMVKHYKWLADEPYNPSTRIPMNGGWRWQFKDFMDDLDKDFKIGGILFEEYLESEDYRFDCDEGYSVGHLINEARKYIEC